MRNVEISKSPCAIANGIFKGGGASVRFIERQFSSACNIPLGALTSAHSLGHLRSLQLLGFHSSRKRVRFFFFLPIISSDVERRSLNIYVHFTPKIMKNLNKV